MYPSGTANCICFLFSTPPTPPKFLSSLKLMRTDNTLQSRQTKRINYLETLIKTAEGCFEETVIPARGWQCGSGPQGLITKYCGVGGGKWNSCKMGRLSSVGGDGSPCSDTNAICQAHLPLQINPPFFCCLVLCNAEPLQWWGCALLAAAPQQLHRGLCMG